MKEEKGHNGQGHHDLGGSRQKGSLGRGDTQPKVQDGGAKECSRRLSRVGDLLMSHDVVRTQGRFAHHGHAIVPMRRHAHEENRKNS